MVVVFGNGTVHDYTQMDAMASLSAGYRAQGKRVEFSNLNARSDKMLRKASVLTENIEYQKDAFKNADGYLSSAHTEGLRQHNNVGLPRLVGNRQLSRRWPRWQPHMYSPPTVVGGPATNAHCAGTLTEHARVPGRRARQTSVYAPPPRGGAWGVLVTLTLSACISLAQHHLAAPAPA